MLKRLSCPKAGLKLDHFIYHFLCFQTHIHEQFWKQSRTPIALMECTRNSFRFHLLTVTDEMLKAACSYLRSISENKFLRVKGPYGTRVGGQIWAARYPGCQPGILDDDDHDVPSTPDRRRVSREIHMTTFIPNSALQLTVANSYKNFNFIVSYGRPK